LTNDLTNSIKAFDKLLIGKDLANDVRLKGLLTQAHELHSRDTLKKSSFPRSWESRVLILLGFVFGKNGFSE